MKCLLTGAAGFIGSHTAERLVASGHDVIGIDSFDGYLYPSEIKRANARALASALPPTRFQLVEADVADQSAMVGIFDSARPDVVCHLAALAGVRPSIDEPLRYVHSNVHGAAVILEACRRTDVRRFVFASSSSVYGARGDGLAFREDEPCLQPASPYAATKRAGEIICSTYRDLFGIGCFAMRYFTVYGPRQRPEMAIHKFVDAIVHARPIQVFGDGASRRDYTYIDDIVSGTVAAVEHVQPGQYEIYNLGGHVTTSLAELVATIEDVVGKRAIIQRRPDQPGDVPLTYADISRAARDLGYAPTTRIRDGLERFYSWYRAHHSS